MKNLKVGDKVKIKQDLVLGESYNHCGYHAHMEEYAGKVATVTEVFGYETDYPNYFLDIDKGKWFWDSEMLEPFNKKLEEESVRLAKAVCEYEEIVHNLEQELHKMTHKKDAYKAMYQDISERFNSLVDEYNSLI